MCNEDVRRDVARIDREMAQREREVRVRVERNDEAANSWVEEIANAQSAEAHEHAVRAYEKSNETALGMSKTCTSRLLICISGTSS